MPPSTASPAKSSRRAAASTRRWNPGRRLKVRPRREGGAAAMNDPNIISLGDDWRSAPREFWGTQDRAQARREGRVRAELDALTHEPEREFTALPVVPLHTLGGFTMNPKPSRSRDARGRNMTPSSSGRGRLGNPDCARCLRRARKLPAVRRAGSNARGVAVRFTAWRELRPRVPPRARGTGSLSENIGDARPGTGGNSDPGTDAPNARRRPHDTRLLPGTRKQPCQIRTGGEPVPPTDAFFRAERGQVTHHFRNPPRSFRKVADEKRFHADCGKFTNLGANHSERAGTARRIVCGDGCSCLSSLARFAFRSGVRPPAARRSLRARTASAMSVAAARSARAIAGPASGATTRALRSCRKR